MVFIGERVLQFASAAESGPEHVAAGVDVEQGKNNGELVEEPLDVSDSESSVASDVELAVHLVGEGPDKDILGSSDFPRVPPSDMLVHSTSGLVHVMNEDSYLLCGRSASRNFKPLTDVCRPLGELPALLENLLSSASNVPLSLKLILISKKLCQGKWSDLADDLGFIQSFEHGSTVKGCVHGILSLIETNF